MEKRKNIGLFFDVDGTLSNSYLLGFNSTNELLRKHGINPVSEEEYHEGTKYSTPMRLAWHVTKDINHPIGNQLGAEFDAFYVNLVSPQTTELYSGIFDMLTYIQRQYPDELFFGALSNACTAYVNAVIEVNQLSNIFSLGLGPDQVPAPKPAPDGLLQMAHQLQVSPDRCVYVGDSPSDGLAASAAGMYSIGVTWGSHAPEKVRAAFAVTVDTVDALKEELISFVRRCRERM